MNTDEKRKDFREEFTEGNEGEKKKRETTWK